MINNPYDIFIMDRHMSKYRGGFYQKKLALYLVHYSKYHMESLRPLEKKIGMTLEELIKHSTTCHEFDRYITSNVFGHGTPDNYYRKASSVLRISDVRTPLFFLSALDDPIAPYIY